MDALEALFTRRSIRKYTTDPVDESDLKTILEAGMNAPSANNQQPWSFVVVSDRAKLDAIMRIHPYSRMLAQAPLAVVVCGDTSISPHYWQQDCAAAVENMLLASRALGLGTVWLGVYPAKDRVEGIRDLLGVPAGIEPMAIIALGHPAVEADRGDRYQTSRVHRDAW